ncbi:MAG: hypothetical protein Q8R35_02440 [bacterium]|nr:hypothetical protein [bacterium]
MPRSPTIQQLILEKIAELGEATIGSFFPTKYPEARMWRELLGGRRRKFSKRSFSAIVSKLRAEGLVERYGSRQMASWRLSEEGRAYLQQQIKPPPKADGIQRLVIFDIPEAMRTKRQAIRTELVSCDYQQLQKSVWLGEKPLSNDFIELLEALDVKPYVHIFSVRKTGTL